jgi:hypothetical protein
MKQSPDQTISRCLRAYRKFIEETTFHPQFLRCLFVNAYNHFLSGKILVKRGLITQSYNCMRMGLESEWLGLILMKDPGLGMEWAFGLGNEAVLKRLKELEKPYMIRQALGDTPRITVKDRDEIYTALSDKSYTKLSSVARPFIPPNASPADELSYVSRWAAYGGRTTFHAFSRAPRPCSPLPWQRSRIVLSITSSQRSGPGYGQTSCRSQKQDLKILAERSSPISPPKAAQEPIQCRPQHFSLRYGMVRSEVPASFSRLQIKSREETGMMAVLRIWAPDRHVAGDRGLQRDDPVSRDPEDINEIRDQEDTNDDVCQEVGEATIGDGSKSATDEQTTGD